MKNHCLITYLNKNLENLIYYLFNSYFTTLTKVLIVYTVWTVYNFSTPCKISKVKLKHFNGFLSTAITYTFVILHLISPFKDFKIQFIPRLHHHHSPGQRFYLQHLQKSNILVKFAL